MPIKRCPEDFQGTNQVPWTFKQIQLYSPAQESSDYKTFDALAYPGEFQAMERPRDAQRVNT